MTEQAPPTATARSRFDLHRDDYGRLVFVDAAGVQHVGVEPVRAFPLSDAAGWVSICNTEGHELVILKSPNEISPDVRQTLKIELARREFLPVIERIVDVTVDVEPTEWTVETDRGPTKFFVDGTDGIRRLDVDRCLIIDTHGVRYLIIDRKRLDAHGRRLLDHYL